MFLSDALRSADVRASVHGFCYVYRLGPTYITSADDRAGADHAIPVARVGSDGSARALPQSDLSEKEAIEAFDHRHDAQVLTLLRTIRGGS